MRTVGFNMYQKKQDMAKLLKRLVKEVEMTDRLAEQEGSRFCELQTKVAPGMGVAMMGEMSPKKAFNREYYLPYVKGPDVSSKAECSIQRHTGRETCAGLLDEYRVDIPLIFYMENSTEHRVCRSARQPVQPKRATLTGLATQGKMLLPVNKTEKQTEDSHQAAKKYSSLLKATKHGDEDIIETLTTEDIDPYSMVSRRIAHEDAYSIVEICFMLCGIECDQYSVIEEITEISTSANRITKKEIYNLKLDCNDMVSHVAINKRDPLGKPRIGRRFKGQVWMQGTVLF